MKKATTPASSPTKPTKPNTPTKKSLSQASPLGNIADELSENPFVVWPEWVDAEVAAEKWNTKHTFEDPDGQIVLPKSIRNSVETSKRIMELSETTPVGIAQNVLETVFQSQQQNNSGMAGSAGTSAPARQTPDNFPIEAQSELSPSSDPLDLNSSVSSSDAPQDVNTISNTAENTISSLKSNSVSLNELDIEEKPITPKVNTTQQENESENDSFSGASQFFLANRHLLGSELIRQILCTLHFIYEQAEQSRQNRPSNTSAVAGIEEAFPWEFIYPKGKDGLPIYNISGKYMVKLYWLGAWRKITVDDRIPVDSLGKPLVITSPFLHELWPMILCKALIKVASTSYKEIDGACEYGDFDILTAMRGWIPERFLLNPSKQDKYLWKTLNTLNLKSQQSNNASNSGSASDKNTSQKSSAPTSSAKVEKGTSSRPSMSSQVVQNAIVHVFAIKDTDVLQI